MKTTETLYVASREEFRRWLAEHHRQKREIWLIFYYKSTGKATLHYGEAVEEAICYGWIDSQLNRLDEERFVRRFTPRRGKSSWSRYNRARALRMLRQGKMTESGMAALPTDLLNAWQAQE